MGSSIKVGELHGVLDLDDKMTAKLKRADKDFKSTGKDMSTEAKLGLDASDMDKGLAAAQKRARTSGENIGEELADGVEASGGSMSSAGAGLGDMLVAGVAGAAALGAAVVVDQFGKALEREGETANLGIKLGLTPEMSKAAGEFAGDIYTQAFGESFEQVGDAVASVGINMGGFGDKSREEVESITKGVLTLVDVFDQDLNRVTGAAGTLMMNGLADTGMEAMDLLTRALQSPANKADDILDTFTEYSTVFRQLGLTGPQALGLMNQALAAGARDSDTVADGLKEFTILSQEAIVSGSNAANMFYWLGLNGAEMARKIAEGGPAAAEALQLTTDRLRNIEDPAIRGQIAIGLFGTKAEDMQGALGAIDLATATEQVGNVEGAMTRATDATSTNQAKVEEWKRSLEANLTNWIAETGIPALQEFGRDWDALVEKWEKGTGVVGDFQRGIQLVISEGIDPWFGTMQRVYEFLGGFIDRLEDMVGWAGDAKDILGGWGNISPVGFVANHLPGDLPGYDVGGQIGGGAQGSPKAILAHVGETVLPTHKMSVGDALAKVLPGFDNGGIIQEDDPRWDWRTMGNLRNGSGEWGPDRYAADQKAAMDFVKMLSNPGDAAILQALVNGGAQSSATPGSPGPGWIQAWVNPADLEKKLGRRSGMVR